MTEPDEADVWPEPSDLQSEVLDLQQWCTDHSHGDLYARLESVESRLGLMQRQILDSAEIGLQNATLCKQCYKESKGEGP